ncbi:MAG: multiheme c-type cytochrome [Planctomycetota bacterium]|nr:multiheme c-type cytochrome [Planctomycetota bacterium]
MHSKHLLLFLLSIAVTGWALALPSVDDSEQVLPTGPGFDPKEVMGPADCIECHKHSGNIWENTPHHESITGVHRSKEGQAIAKKMKIKRITRESLCIDCHGTAQHSGEKTSLISNGISCESCHGAAANWMKRHGEFSGKEEGQETAEEIAARWKEVEAAGMLRPSMVLEIARNCVSCHVVPHEELVNTGGHSSGSDFELLSWSQGMIRHNNFYSKGKENKPAPIEKQRLFHIVGILAEMELVLKAVSTATATGTYAVKNARRFMLLKEKLEAVNEAIDNPQIKEAMAAIGDLKMSLKNQPAIGQAADQITASLNAFAVLSDGSDLEGVDPLLVDAKNYRGGNPEPK